MKRGDTIFYPAHGVAKVGALESHTFGEEKLDFYVLELRRGGRSLVPIKNVAHAGLRQLVSARRARELLKSLRNEPNIDTTRTWKDRAAHYSQGLKTGSPESYTAILQELMYRARADKLSTTETKMLEIARSYFSAEIGEVLDISPEKIDQQLHAAIAALLPDIPDELEDDEDEDGDGDGDEAKGKDSDGEDEDETVTKKKAAKKKAKKGAAKGKKKAAKKAKTAKKKPTTKL